MSAPESDSTHALPRAVLPSLLPAAGLALIATVFVALFWDGGTLETETISFITHYTSNQPALKKIFDPHTNDFNTYQARELSYFFDYLDAHLYQSITARIDASFLIPVSALVTPLAFAIVFARGIRRTAPNLDAVTAALLLACFFSCFVFIATLGLFYRSGKPFLAVTLLAFLFHLRHVQQCRPAGERISGSRRSRAAIMAFTLALVAGLLDRQGFFYVLVACGILFIHFLFNRQLADVLIACVIAAAVLELYNRGIAPWLILKLNGYSPNFSYQVISLKSVPVHAGSALHLLASNVSALLGGFAPVTLGCLGAFAIVVSRGRRGDFPPVAHSSRFVRPAFIWILYAILVVTAHVVMFALMIARHPYVYEWADHRHWYYPLPALAIVLFGMVVGLNAAWPSLERGARRAVQVLLAVLVIGNLASLTHYRRLMLSGPWFGPLHVQSDRLKAFLRTGVENPRLPPNFRAFAEQVRPARRP
jgi:hypothetical protein